MYGVLPTFANRDAYKGFIKFMEADDNCKAETMEKVRQLVEDFSGHFTIEGSFQDITSQTDKSKAFEKCDFQGCETNDWAEGVGADACKKAFTDVEKFLADSKATGHILAGQLMDAMEQWRNIDKKRKLRWSRALM